MLGYALGRGLTLTDSCAVDAIVAQVKENDYKAQSLVQAIVMSVPFRFQAGALPAGNAGKSAVKQAVTHKERRKP
jgi:hypothetical protein